LYLRELSNEEDEEAYWYSSKKHLQKRKFNGWKMEDEGGR